MRGLRWLALRRVIDSLVVLLASPVLVVVGAAASLAVFLEDRAAPLIRLARVGRHGEEMDVTKIRSMRVGGGSAITSSDDDRITRVGAMIRSLRIDEIPQVVQVLSGDMALIGPRPESPAFVDLNDQRWQVVLQARPAIAGMTQVIAGAWEATELDPIDPTTHYRQVALPAKLAIDQWYVENASPLVDLKVIASVFSMLVLGNDATPVHDIADAAIPEAKVFKASREAQI